MKYYEAILEMGCFTLEEMTGLTGSLSAAKSILYEYQKKGYIERVKRDFYVAISLETKQPLMSRYQIGSRLFPDACISHHSAFEVFGYGSQVFYECYVATESRFRDFEYNGVFYHRVERKPETEVTHLGRVCVTSLEQTVVDSIRDFEKIGGLEEVLRCLLLIPELKENEILECLKKNKNGFLYQKCGYLFEELRGEFHFSDTFFEVCVNNSSDARRYLMKNNNNVVLNERWKLYVPVRLGALLDKGVTDYDAIG